MTSRRAKVSEAGAISLPADMRKAIGVERGGEVLVELDGSEIRIRSVMQVVARAQELARQFLAGRPGASVDDFLAQRRAEAKAE